MGRWWSGGDDEGVDHGPELGGIDVVDGAGHEAILHGLRELLNLAAGAGWLGREFFSVTLKPGNSDSRAL